MAQPQQYLRPQGSQAHIHGRSKAGGALQASQDSVEAARVRSTLHCRQHRSPGNNGAARKGVGDGNNVLNKMFEFGELRLALLLCGPDDDAAREDVASFKAKMVGEVCETAAAAEAAAVSLPCICSRRVARAAGTGTCVMVPTDWAAAAASQK